MKYIMYKNKETGNKVPIIFPNYLVHSTVHECFMNDPLHPLMYEIVSAGECTITCSSVSGNSETLGLKFGDGDSQIIDMMDYTHGF